jgi:hypothetical protein
MTGDGGAVELTPGERAIDDLLVESHLSAPHELPGLVSRHAAQLGARDAVAYLVDLQQTVLIPFLPPDTEDAAAGAPGRPEPLSVDGTLAGRAYQQVEVFSSAASETELRVWLPMLDGTERLGVLGVTLSREAAADLADGLTGVRLRRFAALVAEVVMTKTLYGDTIVRLRRREPMGLAAEIQWALLPPLTFSCRQVTVAGAPEPAYEVAGDTLDFAVDAGRTHAAVFDAMGHGLRSSQLAAVTVAAYRNARRRGLSLIETAAFMHDAVRESFHDIGFATGVLAELDTDTGMLTWLNAGHPQPLLVRGGRIVKQLECRPMLPFGMDVGGHPAREPVTVCREQLQRGDRLVLYTDGVVEARSPDGEFFGEQRLVDLISRHEAGALPSAETMRRVVRALLAHQQGRLTDDATLLLLEWCSQQEVAATPE